MALDKHSPRLLLIALDSLPGQLLDRWCEEGLLPNLQSLLREGRAGGVTSDADLFPGAIWPTFFTGSDVSHHGNYHLMQWDPASLTLRPPGPDWCPVTPFWQHLADAGVPVVALDVPFSDTGKDTPNAIEVIGWSMHEGVWRLSHPAAVLRDLRKRHGIPAQIREGPGERPDSEIIPELPGLVADVGRRVGVIEDLATRFDWRLLIAVFSEPHRAGHWFWSERGTGERHGGLKRVVQAFDLQLPRLRRLLRPGDHLAVFSLHGFKDAWDSDRVAEAIQLYMRPPGAQSFRQRLDPVYVARHLLPARIVRAVARKLPQGLYNWTYERLQRSLGEWARLPWVIQPVDHIAYIYSNLTAGDGMSHAARREQLAELEDRLLQITTPDGRPVLERVSRPRAEFHGPRAGLLPDLVPEPRTGAIGPEIIFPGVGVRRPPRHSSRDGEHTSGGFYIQFGPGVPAVKGPSVAAEALAALLCEPAGLVLPASNSR